MGTTQACAEAESQEDRESGSLPLRGVHGGGDRSKDPRGKSSPESGAMAAITPLTVLSPAQSVMGLD